MNVLVINAGSATLKFQVVVTDEDAIAQDTDRALVRGQVERIGGESVITIRGPEGGSRTLTAPLRDVRAAVEWVVGFVTSAESGTGLSSRAELHAVGPSRGARRGTLRQEHADRRRCAARHRSR